MLKTNGLFAASNELAINEYQQTKEAIASVVAEMSMGEHLYQGFFTQIGNYLIHLMAHHEEIQSTKYFDQEFDTLLQLNHQLYEDIREPAYQRSYVNPTFAVATYGKEMGQFLSSIAYLLREYVGLVYENRVFDMKVMNDLYLLLYRLLVKDEVTAMEVLSVAVRDHLIRSMETTVLHDFYRSVHPDFDVYSHIVDHYDLSDLRYLFRYGMYIGDNEIKQATFILALPEDKKLRIADTYTEAYIRGFKRNEISLEGKNSVHVTYHLGFEAIMAKAYKNFEALGLKPFAYYHLRAVQRPRLINTRPNKQMDYDHRFSDAVYLDDVYIAKELEAYRDAAKRYGDALQAMSGLALFEVFGEEDFQPKNHPDNMVYDDAMSARKAKQRRDKTGVFRQYLPGDAYSFTINDYPLPSIGKDYEAIFDATIEVNTLEEPLYEKVQETLIDALDQSDYVVVKGRDGNETNIKVSLHPLTDPTKQTKFDNCTADVNVPVGEVYTSPVLKGTEGLLHVKEVYLTGLKYTDLKIWFKDGMITDYTCSNFDKEEENKNFVRETLMHPHDTLPLGEFAIGTNTVAYMMAKRFDIQAKLPILIGEKTGPHFAIGDTCFVWSEDSPVYNPNGKEVIARENEKTCQRHENPEAAYTYRHTDITIPYNELGTIIGYDDKNNAYEIIGQGRFVLPGTELLNKPFDGE